MQSLIAPEIRPIIKHADRLSREGCSDASSTFASFSYNRLKDASLLPDSLSLEEFSPCDYLSHLQQNLFSTGELNENVTYKNFFIVPESLNASLHLQFGDDVNIDGKFVSAALSSPITNLSCKLNLLMFVSRSTVIG